MNKKKAKKQGKKTETRGRPATPAAEILSEELRVRVSADQYAAIKQDAATAGLKLADYVRSRLGIDLSGYGDG